MARFAQSIRIAERTGKRQRGRRNPWTEDSLLAANFEQRAAVARELGLEGAGLGRQVLLTPEVADGDFAAEAEFSEIKRGVGRNDAAVEESDGP